MRIAVAAVILTATLAGWLAPPAHAGPRSECAGACQDAYDDDRTACASDPDAVDDRAECLSLADDARVACFGVCTDEGRPGRCTLAVECVERCRIERNRAADGCRSRFATRVRRMCREALGPGGCRTCLSSARASRRECRQDCRGTPPATAVTVTSVVTRRRSACQQQCIDGVVGGCYEECQDRCEGDPDALAICRAACRSLSCETLERRCTCTETASSAAYEQCCASNPALCEDDPGGCDGAGDTPLCETTTTRPQSTTTSTTTGSATTTTTSQ